TCTGKIPSGRGRVSEATGSDGPPSVVGPGSAAGDNARRARLQVSLDSMAGAFTEIAPRVLRSAGYAVASLVDRIDPDFTRGAPNPANDRNLALLAKHVRDHASAVGVALDGDGDRVIFVDGRGRIARPEQIAVLLIRHLFSQPLVVYDLKCASIVGQAARDAGGRALMQPSGHGFIKSTIIQQDADLGVEVSGHHFYGSLGGGDDGLFTALVLLELIVRTGKSLAHLLDEVPWPCITPDVRVPFRGESQALLEQIATACGGRVSRLDGVRAEYDEGWALARMSITEPAITFRFEGHDKIALRAIVERFLKSVPELKEAVLERIEQTGSL
ncbi:MAG: hypothetical protein GXP27_09335, partial [Planctomycetes bacterium]|nr:hypothetical protein [Planctomycetota bacterium]